MPDSTPSTLQDRILATIDAFDDDEFASRAREAVRAARIITEYGEETPGETVTIRCTSLSDDDTLNGYLADAKRAGKTVSQRTIIVIDSWHEI